MPEIVHNRLQIPSVDFKSTLNINFLKKCRQEQYKYVYCYEIK